MRSRRTRTTPGHSPGDVCRLCSTRSSSCRDEVPTRYRRTDDRPPPALRGPGARSRSGSPHRLQSAQTGPSGTPGASTNRGRSAERCWRSTGKPGPPAGSLLSGSAGSHRAAAPPFLFTFNHASHTRCLGMSCVLPCNFGSLMRFHPFRLITFVHQDDPAPSLPSPLRYAGGSQLLRASPPARPASVLSPSRIPPLGVLPLACPPHSLPLGTDTPVSGRAFTCSRREPGPGSCCLYAGHHLGSKRLSPRFIPE